MLIVIFLCFLESLQLSHNTGNEYSIEIDHLKLFVCVSTLGG